MLDFRMDTFLTVCKYMNFTKAANELNITQPAVSQHIKLIEQHYQVKLFESQGKKIQLTPAGLLLKNAATTMLHDELHLAANLSSLTTQKPKLNFGITLTIGEFKLPEALSSYIHRHPDTQVRMHVSNTNDLLSRLDDGDIDFAIVEGYFQKSEYDSMLYSKEAFIPIASPDYVFHSRPTILQDLLSEPIITREEGSGTREILEKALEQQNHKISDFHKTVEINNLHAIKTLAKNNCGIAFLYKLAVEEDLKNGTLVELHLDDCHIVHEFTFIWRKGSIYTDYYRELFYELKKG